MDIWVVAGRFVLGFVFVLAGIPKLLRTSEFKRSIESYGLVPRPILESLAAWLPRLEVVAGVALLAGVATRHSAVVLSGALIAFGIADGVALVRRREVSCGCFGSSSNGRVTWFMVTRNAILAVIGFLVAVNAPTSITIGFSGSRGSSLTEADAVAVLLAVTASLVLALILSEWLRLSRLASAVTRHGLLEEM